jgi:23S rRNA (guanine745-N1)-methyltransferase
VILNWNSFICPHDGLSLGLVGASLRCGRGHSFDLAKEGYCNLLLVQQKASHDPGDNIEMVMARRRFLEAGFYQPLAQKITSIASALAFGRNEFTVLDAGSGEGYYLRFLHQQNPAWNCIGIDISKPAVKVAAKKSESITWAVASNKQLPIKNESIDLLLCMFGFPVWKSFVASQKKDGRLVLVDAGPNHLIELREIIYPTVTKSAAPSIEAAFKCGYKLETEDALSFSIRLESATQIQDLLMMTPHVHRISEEGLKKLNEVQHLQLSVDLFIRVLRI